MPPSNGQLRDAAPRVFQQGTEGEEVGGGFLNYPCKATCDRDPHRHIPRYLPNTDSVLQFSWTTSPVNPSLNTQPQHQPPNLPFWGLGLRTSQGVDICRCSALVLAPFCSAPNFQGVRHRDSWWFLLIHIQSDV